MNIDGSSLDLSKDLIQQLKKIIPGAFSEHKLDIDLLKRLLGEHINYDQEIYQLSWAGKSDAYRTLQTPSTHTLLPKFSPQQAPCEGGSHIFIEGENLEVLKILQKSYYGGIKFILIDPPYNTGSDSFVYPDKFSETKEDYLKRVGTKDESGFVIKADLFRVNKKENGQFHSNWLSMMLPRLWLARNLLREDGAIAIHIDEHEQFNLSLLANEIFGEENLIGNIVWDKGNPKGDASGIAYQHETILVYAKNKDNFLSGAALQRKKRNADKILKKAKDLFKLLGKMEIPDELKRIHKEYKLPESILDKFKRLYTLDEINTQFNTWLKRQDFSGGEKAYNKIDSNGDVYRLVSMAWPNKKQAPEDYFIPLIHPTTKKLCPIPQRGWRFPQATMYELAERGEIVFGEDERVQPQRKYLLKNHLEENIPSILFYGGSDDDLLRKLGLDFDNPKPMSFTKSLIQAFTTPGKGDIVLDFFAGSGTTAHAVMEANQDDGGNRLFICIQMPEPLTEQSDAYKKGFRSIAELTLARISEVSKQMLVPEHKVRHFKLSSSNFSVWRGDLVNSESDLTNQLSLFSQSITKNAESFNIVWELLIKSGLPLTENVQMLTAEDFTIYFAENNKIAICLNSFSEDWVQAITKLTPLPKLVICLDIIFGGNDCKKANCQLKLQDLGINFRTI